jgi:hypothetical protein
MHVSYRSSSQGWKIPKPISDPSRRRMIYGRIQPMHARRTLLDWLLRR